MGTYFSIHNHTCYSNLRLIDSINKPEQLIDYAYEIGLAGVAITDHESLSAHIRALNYFEQKYKDKNFKLVLGNEIYIARNDLRADNYVKGEPFFHFILLAKDYEGYHQLRQLSTRAWKRSFVQGLMSRVWNTPEDLYEIVKGQHLVASSACIGGYLGRKWKDGDYASVERFSYAMAELFGKDHWYIELQPSFQPDQIEYNKFLIKTFWGKLPFIFTTDSHYLTKEKRSIHKAFLNSKQGEREVDAFYASAYMMSYDEVWDYFKDYITPEQMDEMAQNTIKILSMIQPFDLKKPQVIPYTIHETIEDRRPEMFALLGQKEYQYLRYFLTTNDDSDGYFMKKVALGWFKEEVPNEKTEAYLDELEIELRTIALISENKQNKLANYFTTMAKLMDIIWHEADSLVGPSRGSAGAFLINYLLGITQMNPLEQPAHMAAWRFLDPERPDYPDIDFDTESFKRVKVFNKIQEYFRSIGGDVYAVCTFGTCGTKNALKTAARGLGIDEEIVSYLGAMVPNERGFDWTLDQCYYGDEEHNAITAFKEEIDQYPELWEVAHEIEGLVVSLGVHASGIVCVNGDINDYNSVMRARSGVYVTALDLHDSEACGLIKYDMLTVSALDRIRQCFNYLLENHEIEWQGDLKSTYDKYLNPKILDYTSKEMWDMVDRGEITALFQFDTAVGSQAVKSIQPQSLMELAVGNAVMRLMCEGELPLDTYVRFKNDISQWYSEMAMYGLTEAEVAILEKYLLPYYGVAATQEVVMELSMDPGIAGFTMVEANKLRKTIAKKQFDQIEAVHQLFLNKGQELGNSKRILDYVWDVQVKKSLGYSFSVVHTTGYSILAIQEMNLAYKWPIIYWNCACLSVDSSAIDESDFDNLLDEGIIDLAEIDEADKRDQSKVDVSKIILAVNRFKDICTITPPDINRSKLGFMPNVDKNEIMYGLKGITLITAPVIQEIMEHRPYTSLTDFVSKVNKRIVNRAKIVNLIKAGCFNEVEGRSVKEILRDYILSTCDQKGRLTMQNANMLIDFGLLPDELADEQKGFKVTKELRKYRDDSEMYYILGDTVDRDYVMGHNMTIEAIQLPNGRVVEAIDSGRWDGLVYEGIKAKTTRYIKAHEAELLERLNHKLFQDDWDKYAAGDEAQWELDSLNYYKTRSPLWNIMHQIPVETNLLSEIHEGEVDGWFNIKGKRIPKMHLYTVVGTVLNKNTTKGMVTVQTVDGILLLKLYKGLFSFYANETNGPSFFEKGTHLLITGVSRGSMFIPKVYKNSNRKSLVKINILPDNTITFENKIGEEG